MSISWPAYKAGNRKTVQSRLRSLWIWLVNIIVDGGVCHETWLPGSWEVVLHRSSCTTISSLSSSRLCIAIRPGSRQHTQVDKKQFNLICQQAVTCTVFDLISGVRLTNLLGPPKEYIFLLFLFLNFDRISGPSTSGHVWPSGLYIVNLYCLHKSFKIIINIKINKKRKKKDFVFVYKKRGWGGGVR